MRATSRGFIGRGLGSIPIAQFGAFGSVSRRHVVESLVASGSDRRQIVVLLVARLKNHDQQPGGHRERGPHPATLGLAYREAG